MLCLMTVQLWPQQSSKGILVTGYYHACSFAAQALYFWHGSEQKVPMAELAEDDVCLLQHM